MVVLRDADDPAITDEDTKLGPRGNVAPFSEMQEKRYLT